MAPNDTPEHELTDNAAAAFLELSLENVLGGDGIQGVDRDSLPIADAGYKILGLIGEGGMGKVWRAQQLGTGQTVALKALKRGLLKQPGTIARFHTEVQLAARLKHPSIARVFDSGLDRLDYFYVMELIDGKPADDFVNTELHKSRDIVQLMMEACEAIAYAHNHGVVHLDLKPTNILVTEDGRPHILDFGLARAIGTGQQPAHHQLFRAGTLGYMAPEQVNPATSVDKRADVYALGRILGELLNDVLAESGETGADDLIAIIRRATAEEQADRYPDATALAQDLNSWLALKPVSAGHHSIRHTTNLWIRRNRLTLRRALFVLIPLIAVTSGIALALHQKAVSIRAIGEHNDATLYRSAIRTAHEKLNQGDVQEAQRLLADTQPNDRGWEWAYLSGLADQSVYTIAFDGEVISDFALLENDTVLCLMSSGELRRVTSQDETSSMTTRSVSNALPMALGANAEYTIHLDNMGRGVLRWAGQSDVPQTVQITNKAMTHVQVSPSGRYVFAVSFHDGMVLYDTRLRAEAYRIHQPSGVTASSFSNDERYLVWYDGKYRLLNLETLSLASLSIDRRSEEGPNVLAAFGSMLYAGYDDGSILAYDLAEGATHTLLGRLPAGITKIRVSPDGHILACGGKDGAIRLVTNNGQPIRTFNGHTGSINKIRFSIDGERIYSLSSRGKVKVWDIDWTAYEHKPWPSINAALSAMDSSGRYFAYTLTNTIATVYDSQAGETKPDRFRVTPLDKLPTALALTPDGNWLGVADEGRTLRIYDGLKVLARAMMTDEPAWWIDFSAWDHRLAASNSQEVLVLTEGNEKPMRWQGRTGPCAWLRSVPSYLAMIRHNQAGYSFEVRDADADLQTYLEPFGPNPIISMATARDVGRVAVVDSEGQIKVYDVDTSNVYTMTTTSDIGSVLCLALSPDGSRLVTAGDSVAIWSVDQGKILDVLHTLNNGPIMGIQFTGNGKDLIGRGMTGYYRWRTR